MENVKIIIDLSVTENTNMHELCKEIADKLREIASPVRTDNGIATIHQVRGAESGQFQNIIGMLI
jgi:hypothetical protein